MFQIWVIYKNRNIFLKNLFKFEEKYIFTCSSDGNIGIVKIMENEGEKKYEMSLIKVVKDVHEQYSVNSLCVNKNEVIYFC